MKLFALALVAALLPAQIRQPAANIRFGSTLPSTCTANIGQVFFLTSASAGANLYGCTATNTWTAQGSGVGGASNLTTVGAVPYVSASGVLNQDASNFFWDATNHRLGIGTNAPANWPLEIWGTNAIFGVKTTAASGGYAGSQVYNSTGALAAGFTFGSTEAAFYMGSRNTSYPTRFTYGNSLTTNLAGTITTAGIWGIGTSNTAPTGTLSVLDRTATTGATSLLVGSDGTNTSATTTQMVVKAGTAQSTTDLQQWQNSSGTVLASVSSAGYLTLPAGSSSVASFIMGSKGAFSADGNGVFIGNGSAVGSGSSPIFNFDVNNQRLGMAGFIGFGASTPTSLDTSLSRCTSTAGCVAVGTGAAGSTAGTLQAKSVAIISPTVPATAADACTAGAISWDTSYIYVCTASGAWKRSAIATW